MNEIYISLITAAGTMAASWFSYRANQAAKQGKNLSQEINEAVNYRGDRPRLYELVFQNHQRVDKLEKKMDRLSVNVKKLSNVVTDHEEDIDAIETHLEQTKDLGQEDGR